MEIVLVLIGLFAIIGVIVAVLEHRKKTTFLKHNLNLRGPSTEADREAERAAQAINEAGQRGVMVRHD